MTNECTVKTVKWSCPVCAKFHCWTWDKWDIFPGEITMTCDNPDCQATTKMTMWVDKNGNGFAEPMTEMNGGNTPIVPEDREKVVKSSKTETDYKLLAQNLANALYQVRQQIDNGEHIYKWNSAMISVDAALEQWEEIAENPMEFERAGNLTVVTQNKVVYYRVQYTHPYTYKVWYERQNPNATVILTAIEDKEFIDKLEQDYQKFVKPLREQLK